MDPATRENLLAQRREFRVEDSVDRLAREAVEVDHVTRVRPARLNAAGALGVAGLALEIYDGADSLRTAQRLRGEGNATAAESELVHFGARSVGGWTGAGIGMAGGALLGVKSGPGLLVTGTIGGVAGVFAGDKFAEWTDNRRIYNQELGGNTWTYDPESPALGWRRQAPIDSTNDSFDNARRGDLRASPATENQLNYQATSVSVELVLGGPPAQRNPFSLPAEAGDPPSSQPTNWERNPETGKWQREVYGPFVERGGTPHYTDTADDARAARLDRQAAAIVVENAANSPASIAARYEDTYIRNGWAAYGPMPEAVRNARTNIGKLVSSEGDLYERQADGRWVSDGMFYDSTASGNLHDELEATRAVLEARLPPPREIPPVPPMDAEARLRDAVAGAYRNAGVDVDDWQVAIAAAAVRATWDANGLDPATTALQVKPAGRRPLRPRQPDRQPASGSRRPDLRHRRRDQRRRDPARGPRAAARAGTRTGPRRTDRTDLAPIATVRPARTRASRSSSVRADRTGRAPHRRRPRPQPGRQQRTPDDERLRRGEDPATHRRRPHRHQPPGHRTPRRRLRLRRPRPGPVGRTQPRRPHRDPGRPEPTRRTLAAAGRYAAAGTGADPGAGAERRATDAGSGRGGAEFADGVRGRLAPCSFPGARQDFRPSRGSFCDASWVLCLPGGLLLAGKDEGIPNLSQ